MSTPATQPPALDPAAVSWAMPGTTDVYAIYGLICLLLVIFLVIYLYALFDRYAEGKGQESLFRTTIPTMLTIGLVYDIMPPLEGVNILLPLSLILAAAARDIVLWTSAKRGEVRVDD